MANCVMCALELDPAKKTFEQRLVDDDSFCVKCWTEIMVNDYDSDVDYNLQVVQ
jgi:hypothetical protein